MQSHSGCCLQTTCVLPSTPHAAFPQSYMLLLSKMTDSHSLASERPADAKQGTPQQQLRRLWQRDTLAAGLTMLQITNDIEPASTILYRDGIESHHCCCLAMTPDSGPTAGSAADTPCCCRGGTCVPPSAAPGVLAPDGSCGSADAGLDWFTSRTVVVNSLCALHNKADLQDDLLDRPGAACMTPARCCCTVCILVAFSKRSSGWLVLHLGARPRRTKNQPNTTTTLRLLLNCLFTL